MKRILFRLSLVRALGLAMAAFLTSPASAQQPANPPPRKLDITKYKAIERPAQELINAARLQEALNSLNESELVRFGRDLASKAAIAGAQTKSVRLDKTKTGVIEGVGEGFLANSAPASTVPSPMKPNDAKENPTVKPGEVKWHPTFAAAREAARNSHKPVLLLHMMGRLDKQFC